MIRPTGNSATRRLVRMLEGLGRVSDEQGKLTRTFLSPAMQRANEKVGVWMRKAGLNVRVDAVGNLIGRREGRGPRAKTLLLGSHLDTVRDAGRFDGALGVLLPIVALQELARRQVELPYAVEVLGFSEEEGVRFSSAYVGSKGYVGRLRARDLGLRDAKGVRLREALGRFNRGRFSPRATRTKCHLIGYTEIHIEQGPVLESEGLAVGVVSAIAGQTRLRVTWRGKAGHAGTTPMRMRRDALAGAAEFICAAEKLAAGKPPLVVTVGTMSVVPGAANVIPGEVVISLDIRHPRDDLREAALERLVHLAQQIAGRRKLHHAWEMTQDDDAVKCSAELTSLLAKSVRTVQGETISLVSGAGHDGVVMSTIAPVAMLFVRCRDGLSHHPDEFASPADIAVALEVMVDYLMRLAQKHGIAQA